MDFQNSVERKVGYLEVAAASHPSFPEARRLCYFCCELNVMIHESSQSEIIYENYYIYSWICASDVLTRFERTSFVGVQIVKP